MLSDFSGQKNEKCHGADLGDSSYESGDEVKHASTSQQSTSCVMQQQQLIDRQEQSSSEYQLPSQISSTSSSTPYSSYLPMANLTSHHSPCHHLQTPQHQDTNSESEYDKRHLHHQLRHLQNTAAAVAAAHGLAHHASTSVPLPSPHTVCSDQKNQIQDYMENYNPQVSNVSLS